MDELKNKVEAYVQLIASIDNFLKTLKDEQAKNVIRNKCKSSVVLEMEIIVLIQKISQTSNQTRETKLLLDRLRNCYNEAHDKYDKLYEEFNIKLEKKFDYNIDPEIFNENVEETHKSNLRRLDSYEEHNKDLLKIKCLTEDLKQFENSVGVANELFQNLHSIANQQNEKFENIESNIENTVVNIKQGTEHLNKARIYKLAHFKKILPLASAATAASLTGPIGLVYGFKFGSIATIALSSVCGFVGGKICSNKLSTLESKKD